ncbi:unnamed protein product [Amoebophrya sp. A120]|nr:unnamed protein product [Amoebophrya sp. A120]|eukprot:GSA120T00003121001.1
MSWQKRGLELDDVHGEPIAKKPKVEAPAVDRQKLLRYLEIYQQAQRDNKTHLGRASPSITKGEQRARKDDLKDPPAGNEGKRPRTDSDMEDSAASRMEETHVRGTNALGEKIDDGEEAFTLQECKVTSCKSLNAQADSLMNSAAGDSEDSFLQTVLSNFETYWGAKYLTQCQRWLLKQAREETRNWASVCLESPAGSGKSIGSVFAIARALQVSESKPHGGRLIGREGAQQNTDHFKNVFEGPATPRVLVIASTRILAEQTRAMIRAFCHGIPASVQLVTGDEERGTDEAEDTLTTLARCGADILVATPGKLRTFLQADMEQLQVVEEQRRQGELSEANAQPTASQPESSSSIICLDKVELVVVEGKDLNSKDFFPDLEEIVQKHILGRRIGYTAKNPFKPRFLWLGIGDDMRQQVEPRVKSWMQFGNGMSKNLGAPLLVAKVATASETCEPSGGRIAEHHLAAVEVPAPSGSAISPEGGYSVDSPQMKQMTHKLLDELRKWHNKKPSFRSLVFVNERVRAHEVAQNLQRSREYWSGSKVKGDESGSAESLSGDMDNIAQEMAVGRLNRGETSVLVTTDIGKSGLNFTNVDIVFNFDFPRSADDFSDRCGRAGRTQKGAEVMSLIPYYAVSRGDKSAEYFALCTTTLPLLRRVAHYDNCLDVPREIVQILSRQFEGQLSRDMEPNLREDHSAGNAGA